MVINTETNEVIANLFIAPQDPDYTDPKTGVTITSYSFPQTVALSPDDKYAYVGTGSGDGRVIVIDVSTNKIVQTIEVERGIWDIAVAPDGKHVYAATGDDKIFVIDTATNITAALTGFGSPLDIAITHDGNYAYVPNNWNNTVFVIDTETNVVDRTVSVGQGPREIVFTPDGKTAYVTCDVATALPNESGTVYAGTVWVISTSEDSTSPQAASPVAEFPTQLLIVIILVTVIALSAGIIAVKIKPWKKPPAIAQRIL